MKNLKKPANLFMSGYSYLLSSLSHRPYIYGMPVSVGIELTNYCNLHCPECLTGSGRMKREKGFMDIELFNKVINELSPYLYNAILYFQGEPMLHPMFFHLLEACKEVNTTVSTNGHYLSEENSDKIVRSGLNKLIISLDGLTQETYSFYRRNGSLDTVLGGIKNVADAKKRSDSKIDIELQFLVNSINEYQIPQIRSMAKNLKVGLKLKSMQLIGRKNIGIWLPANKKFSRYSLENGESHIKNSFPDRCQRLWFTPVITWDGKVVPCCFDKDSEYIMGDLNKDSFHDIWNGEEFRAFRMRVLTGRHTIGMCRNCTSGLKGVKI